MGRIVGKEELRKEIKAAIRKLQPKLQISERQDGFELTGEFDVMIEGECLKTYQISCHITQDYKTSEPHVYELGGDIPQDGSRHTFVSGRCCLGAPWEWKLFPQQNSVEKFLKLRMQSYFFSQVYFEEEGTWPFGDLDHGKQGIIQSIAHKIQVNPTKEAVEAGLKALEKPKKYNWAQLSLTHPGLVQSRKTVGPNLARKLRLELRKYEGLDC